MRERGGSSGGERASAAAQDDALCARLGGKHAQDARAAAHVQHRLARKEVLVAHDGVHVAARAHLVLEHLLHRCEKVVEEEEEEMRRMQQRRALATKNVREARTSWMPK